jgi:hypothetical protein
METMAAKLPGVRRRWGIYGLLTLCILMGLSLSTIIDRTGQDVHAPTVPLLDENPASTEQISCGERAVAKHSPLVIQYFSYPVPREHFEEQHPRLQQKVVANVLRLERTSAGAPATTRAVYNNLAGLDPQLDALISAKDIDWAEAMRLGRCWSL